MGPTMMLRLFALLFALLALSFAIDPAAVKDQEEQVGASECEACKFVVNIAENFLAENKTEQEIEEALEKVCKVLPSKYQSICTTIVESYVPTVIALLEAKFPAETVCTAIGVCTTMSPLEKIFPGISKPRI